VVAKDPYRQALAPLIAELGPMRVMRPAERELREDLSGLTGLEVIPHEGWLTTREQFDASQPKRPFRMDRFYRHVRKATGLLMQQGAPVGGKWSFDAENRRRWPGKPLPPRAPRFEPDEITLEVGELIEKHFAHHPGRLDLSALPASAADAERFWDHAKRDCLPLFGPYEDAMSVHSRHLFHSRVSLLLNLGRLSARQLLDDVAALPLPLPSKEGFIRQILGWREFMRHVHEATDGFRDAPATDPGVARDGGYAQWAGRPWPGGEGASDTATPSHLGARDPLPPVYWGKPSGLHCVDTVVRSVWDEGYSHHITRLMVLSNLASLLDVSPRQLTDWFWVAYVDAYDWVVEPNVLAMGTWSVADLVVTKPYVASANYIHKMSDYCGDCRFDPKTNCPFTGMYWAFLARHHAALKDNPRMFQMVRMFEKRTAAQRKADAAVFERTRAALQRGEELR
jgi:deoxyribodipyrimidine photolyase-related protein